MKTKTIIILLYLVTQVLQTNGLIQLKNSLAHSDSPLLKKILELVDTAINDEHLLQVTLKLLRSLCICMRETLKSKEVNLNVGNPPLDLNESSGTEGKVFELYKNIYNNTCFNLRQDLTNRTYKFIVDEEAEFLNHTNCGKDEKNETIDERDDSGKSPAVMHLTTSRLEQVLFKALIQTKDLHEYRFRNYNLFGKGTPQLKKALQNILIVILTLYPDKQELSSKRNNIDEKDLNKTLNTKSPIDVDFIRTEHDQKRKYQAIKAEILSECNLQSLFISLTESDRNNQIKVFKLIRKRDTIKIYTEAKITQNHTDLINICCKNGTTIPRCNRKIMNDFTTQPKLIDEHYKNTITKIRSLVNQYEHKLNGTTHHNTSTTFHDEKKEENFITESTTKQSGTNAVRINDKEDDIQVSVTNSKESSKLGEVTQAIVLLNDFVSKQTTKTYSQTHQTHRTGSFKPWTEFMLKEEIQQDITTPYNSINIGTLDVKVQEEKSHHTSIGSLPIFQNNKDARIENYAPENVVKTTTMFKEYKTSNKQEKNEPLGVTLRMSQEKHETEEELRQASTSRTNTVLHVANKSYTVESSSIINDVNTDLYTIHILKNSIIANQVTNTVTPTLNDTDKLSKFTTPELITGKTLIPNLGINQYDYETDLLRQHIIKISDNSSTTTSSTDQSTESTLENNTTLSTDFSTLIPIFNNYLYGGEQALNDAQNISETSIFLNSTDVTKSIAESELINEIFVTEESKASVSNAIPTDGLTENVDEIGQHFTLGESILDDVVKPKETKTSTSDSPAIKNISETSIKSTFQNIAPNTPLKPATTPESYKQSDLGHEEDITTIGIVSKAEPTSEIAFCITVEEPNEKKGTQNVTPESIETNTISETTTFQNVAINTKPESSTTLDDMYQSFLGEKTSMKPKFKDIATNMTLESLITLSTLDFINSLNLSGNSDMEGINITDRVTKAESVPFDSHVLVDAPTEQTDSKTFTSEYLETNNISERTMKTITNSTLELLTILPLLDFTNSQNQSVNDDVEGINITESKAKSSPFASHIMVDAPHGQTETKTFTSESLETNNISETTIRNVAINTNPESITTVFFTKSHNQLFLGDMGGINIIDRVRVTKVKPMSTIDFHIKVDELNKQTEPTIKTKFKDIATNMTLESLTALSTIDSTESHKQSVYDDIAGTEPTDIVTKAEPMSTVASHIMIEAPNEQTKTSTSEYPETSNISETTMKTTFWNVTTNTTLELLTKLSTLGFIKSHNQSIDDDKEGINTIDRITKAEPLSTFASHVSTLDDVVHQEETKTFTSESSETNKILETTMETTFQNMGTNTTLESLTALSTIDSTKSHKQSVYYDIEGTEPTNIVTKAEPMSNFASHIMIEAPNEQTKTSTSEYPETSNISETTKATFWNVTTNMTLESLTELSTIYSTKSHKQSIHDGIEGINTIDRITEAEPLSTFASHVSTLDDVVHQAETKTFTSESSETNKILETTMETTFQNMGTNTTLESLTALSTIDSTKSHKQSIHDYVEGINTIDRITKAEPLSTFASHVSTLDDVGHQAETKTFTTESSETNKILETTMETTFQNMGTNTTLESLTALSTIDSTKSHKQSIHDYVEGINTIDRITKAEPLSTFASHVSTLDDVGHQAETKTFTTESSETNKILETTMETTFQNMGTNTTLESLTALSTIDSTKSHKQSVYYDIEGTEPTNIVTKAEPMSNFASHIMIEAPNEQTKTSTSEYPETSNISETTKATFWNVTTNMTLESLTELSTIDSTKSHKQSIHDDIEGINTIDKITEAEPLSTFASHVSTLDDVVHQAETKTFTSQSSETNKILETTMETIFQNMGINTTLESLITLSAIDSTKSHKQSIHDDIEEINTIDRITEAEPLSTFASHVSTLDDVVHQAETKTFTSESSETNKILETTMETTFQNMGTNTTLESLTALSTIDSTKSHKQSFDDIEGINTIDIITKAEPLSIFASHVSTLDDVVHQEETKTFTSESSETNKILETTMETTFQNMGTNTTLESLTALSTIDSTKSHKQSIHDDIEGINTFDKITKAEPLSTFASHVSTLDDVVHQAETKTFTSESSETNKILETTFQNMGTNMTLEPFTPLSKLDSTKSDNQTVYDDIEGIDTATKAELMSTFGSHVTVDEPNNHIGQELRTNVTKNDIIKISTIETTFSKSTEDLNNTYNGMNFDMLEDLFEEGESNKYTNDGTERIMNNNEQSYMTTGVPILVNTEENTVITKDVDNEITIKSIDALTSAVELHMIREFYKKESHKLNSTFPDTIFTNPSTDTNTQSYKTTALSVDTEETKVNTQDTVSTLLQNVTDNEINMKCTRTVTPEQELRITTEFNKEEPNKHNATFPGIISTQSVSSTELILQSEIVSTYSANPPKSRDTVDKQNNQSTELFYTAISTEPYKTVREAYTTLIPTLIKHSVTTGNPEFYTSDYIQNTESNDIQTAYDTTDIYFFDNDYEVANNLAMPALLSAKTNTLSEATEMERNENNFKSEPVTNNENNNLEKTSIFIEATTGFDESLSSEILDIMNLTTNIPFTKPTLPSKLEKDILQKELETEDTGTLNDTFVITTYSGIEEISDVPSRNDSKALPQEELVKNTMFHKNGIIVSNTSLEQSYTLKKNLSSKHSLSAKLNEKDPFQKESEIEVTVAFYSSFETSTNSEMERISDELSENKIKVPKNDSESLVQEESVVNRLLDKEASLLFYTSREETFTSKRNFSEISLDTHTESVQKVDNNDLKTFLNKKASSISESSSPYLSSTEITTTDLPEFTRKYITIIANISANNLLEENNAIFIHKELSTMPESGTKQTSTETFTVDSNSTIFFTKELSDTVDMEVTTLRIIAQQDQIDESLRMPTSIIAVGSSLDSITQSTLKHKEMKKVSVPGIKTKNYENILDDIIITDELISSPTHTETTTKDESRNEDFDYFGNDGNTLTLGNESSTKNIAVIDPHENIQEKRILDPSTSAITPTTEMSTLVTLILKNLSSTQTIIQNNKEDLITTESKPEIIDMNNDTNVENTIESSLFTPESEISDLILSTPATLSSAEVMQDTTINKQLTTSDMRIKESALFTTESVNSDLQVSTTAPLSSMEVMQNNTKSKQLTKSDMNSKQIIESPYIGTTLYTFVEAFQTTQLDGPNATITGPIFEANEETKTEKLAQLNDILTHITTQQTNFMTQPVYKDYTLFEEETESSIEPTTSESVKIQFYSDKSKNTPVYDITESIINARIENASTESFSFEPHIQESSIVNKPFSSHVIESTKISPKSITTFTQANKNYTKKGNFKRSKTLKLKKPIAFELNIRVGVEANKYGIKFSVLDEKETVIHEKTKSRLPETIHFNPSADNDIQDTSLRSQTKFANETVNNNTTSLRNKKRDIDLNKMTRRSHNVTNEDLRRITEILKKLSWNPPAKTQRRRKFPKHTITRKSFLGNTTIYEGIQLDQVNTTSYNATTTSTHKNFTSIKHKSIMPGALTGQHAITNITSIYKEHFEKLKHFMNYPKNGNISTTDVLKKTYEAMLLLPVTENIENTQLYTTGVNNTLHEDQEGLEVGSRTLGSAKNKSIKFETTLDKNETSRTSKNKNKNFEIMLKKLLKGKKLSKRQLRKFKRKLLKKLTSKKNITSVHKFHDTVKKKTDVMTTNTVTLTTPNKYTTIQADDITGIQNVEVLTSSSSYSEKPNIKIVSFENNKTQSEEKIRKGIDKQAAAVVILNTTSKDILQGGRRLINTHSNKSLLSHEIEQKSSKFKAETTFQNTSIETNISFSKVAAITSKEEALLSEMVLKEIDEDMSKPENESIKDTGDILTEVIHNSSDALTKTEIKKETLSLFDSHYSDLMEELNVVLTQHNNNKTLLYSDVNSTSSIMTDAKNTTVITNTESNNSANRYEIDEKIITAPFTTVVFDGTTPFLKTVIETVEQNKFSSNKEDSKFTVPMTTVKSNIFDNSEFQSDDNETEVTFPVTSRVLTITDVVPQMSDPNDNITKTMYKVITNIRDTKHYFKDDILDEIPDQSSKASEFFLKKDYRGAENLKIEIKDISNTPLPPTGEKLSFTRSIQIFTDTNHDKYEGFETTASIPSASATTNNSQDIISTSPSEFDILTTYHPDVQPSIISMYLPKVTDFPGTLNKSKIKETVADKSLDREKGRNINNGNLSVDELKYFNVKSMTNSSTIDYISASTLSYEELKSTDQMFSGSKTLLPEDSSINKNVSAGYNFTITTDIFEHITDSVESTITLDKKMYKEKQNRNKNISKEITNKVNNDFEILKTCTNINLSNVSMTIGQNIIMCLRKKIMEELKTSSSVIQDLNITTQYPMKGYFINFADDERESQHGFISTLGTEEYIETTSNIPDVSTNKLPLTQIPSKILKTEKETEGLIHEKQMRKASNYNNTTSTKNTHKQHLSTDTSDGTGKNIENLNNNQKMTKKIQSSQKILRIKIENLLPGLTIANGSATSTATDSTGLTLTSQIGNISSMIPESLSGTHTRQIVLNQSIVNKDYLTGVNYGMFVDNNTETIKISSDSSPITTQYIIAVTDNVNQFTNVSKDASTHGDKTSSIEIREHEKILEKQLKNVNKTQLFYVVDKSVNVTNTERRNIMNSSKTDPLVSVVQNRTKKSQVKTHPIFVKVYEKKKISVTSTPTLSYLKVTQMNPFNKTTVDLKPEISSIKAKLGTNRTNQNGTKGKGYQSNYKSVFPNVASMEYKENIRSGKTNTNVLKMELFSSRLNRPHNLLPTTTACTKNIKYNTYRPITKEELEILKYFSDPILNTILHKQVDDKRHSQVSAFNHSNAAMKRRSNISQSESNTILRAVNNSKAKQMIYAKNQGHGDKDLHLTLATNKNLNQSIEVIQIPHSSEINRISHPILEININSPQIKTNGNPPPMIEINGNPLPIEINRNSAPLYINENSAPMGINENSAPMGMNGNSAPMGINGNLAPMGINVSSAQMAINGNSAPMGNSGNYAPMGINTNSEPMGINENSAPTVINGNSLPMGNNENSIPMAINGNSGTIGNNGNSAPMGINENSAPMGMNGNYVPMDINTKSAPMGINRNSAPKGSNGNSATMVINGNSLPMGNNENSAPMAINGISGTISNNGNSAPIAINGNSGPIGNFGTMSNNGNSAPRDINTNSASMGNNGNSVPMAMNGNSAPMRMNVNSGLTAMNGNLAPMGINGNSAPMRTNLKYVPIGINGNSLTTDITRNSAPKGTNGNSAPVRVNGNSMTMNINRNLVPMDITNNPGAIEMNGNSMPMGNNEKAESIGTHRSPVLIVMSGNQVPMGTNGNLRNSRNLVPIPMNENSVPIGINRNSVMIDSNRNPMPMEINENSAPMRTSGNSMTMNINRNPVPMEINSIPVPIELNRNSIPLTINGFSVTMVADRKLEPLGNKENPMPMNITKNSVQMGIHGNSVPTIINKKKSPLVNNVNSESMDTNSNLLPINILRNSEPVEINRTPVPMEINKNSVPKDLNGTPVPMEINKTSVPSEIDRNPAPTEATRNQVLMDINTNSLLIKFNRSTIPQKNNRILIPLETNNNSNPKKINRVLPRILETNRNTSPTPNLNRNTISMMNSSLNKLNLSPTNDKNRSTPSMDENNTNVLVDNKNLSSTTYKPWISASTFNNNGNSHATIDNNSSLHQKDQNSLLTLNRNKYSPSFIDIDSYSLVVNKNSPTIIHNKWNLSSIMGNNKKAPSMADNINRHSINGNTKTTSASGNNMNAHSVIDDNEKSSKNIDNKKNKPSGTRDQDNNKNSLSVVANVSGSPPTVNLHSTTTMETYHKSPLVNFFNHIAHSTVKCNIISASPTTETKTSEAIVATRKKILPMKELKRKPFLTFKSNKQPLSITGKKINTHGPLEINRNTHTKFVSKNFKRIGSQKETLLHSFESMNPYVAKIKEPSVKPEIKQMRIGSRRKAVKTINTQDFISQHRYVSPRSVLQKTTKPYAMFFKPQRLMLKSKTLRPKFDSIDKAAKRLAPRMKPKLVFKKGRSGQNFQRMVPKRARVNNVLDMPIWHTTLKPKFLINRNDAIDFMFDENYIKIMKMTRRPEVTDDLSLFANSYNSFPALRKNNIYDMPMPATESGRKRQKGRTIFFLSPTEFYDEFN